MLMVIGFSDDRPHNDNNNDNYNKHIKYMKIDLPLPLVIGWNSARDCI